MNIRAFLAYFTCLIFTALFAPGKLSEADEARLVIKKYIEQH